MPQKAIRFKGINRKINEFQTSGECEELINLRTENNGGISVVKPKSVVEADAEYYDYFFVHTYGDVYNHIVVHDRNGIQWVNASDGVIRTITATFAGKDVTLSSAGNVLIIYCEEDKKQEVYKFIDGEYGLYDVSIKTITDVEIAYAYSDTNMASCSSTADDTSLGAYNEALNNTISVFNTKFPHGLCGAAIIGCTYELDDGSELWSTAFITANVTRCTGYTAPSIDSSSKTVTVTGARKVTLRLAFADVDASSIKGINIYASRPVLPFEVENEGNGHYINQLALDDVNLAGQLMYYQGTIIPEGTSASYVLDFGAEQAGEKVMEVTSGCIERTGNSISYNNRFHFFRSDVQHIIQIPTMSYRSASRSETSYWVAYVNFNGTWKLLDKKYYFSEGVPQDFIYPMAGVKQLAFVKAEWDDYGNFSVPYEEMFYVDLKDSPAYNYSYAFDVTPSIINASAFEVAMEAAGQAWGAAFDTKVFWKNETNAINVSAQYNPYVFPVEYSYSVGGEISDVATSYLPISTTQIGQYPLVVFTSNGIYALEQGDGATLYGAITPLQPLVISGKSASTPYGTFFISARSLFLLSGREVADVSYILDGPRELKLRENADYKEMSCNDSGIFYSFEQMLSSVDFEEFIINAVLTYDQLHNELYISSSNDDLPYSYVFNIDTKSYHKVTRKFLQQQSGSRYAIEVSGGAKRVVDLQSEDDTQQPILLQSRPFPLEMLYTHIQRFILLADAELSDAQSLCLTVFAGSNLNDWKCIASSQKWNVALRHIRTNRAAKSHKDYIVLINGTVSTETDISDLIADYTVVNRRLG